MPKQIAGQEEAQLLASVKTAPWPQQKNVALEGMRVLNAVWARQQRAINAVVVKRQEGVNAGMAVQLLVNARRVAPLPSSFVPYYLLDLREVVNAL